MEAAKHEISSGDSPGTDHDSEEHVSSDLPKSHSSTIAGKDFCDDTYFHLCLIGRFVFKSLK